MELLAILLAIAIFIVLPVVIGFGILGLLKIKERGRATGKRDAAWLACSMDADCPQGYICSDGTCVPARS